jgi:phospholipid/cholesterol/gamma-HCH transport system ATP-binding protein
MASNEKIIEVNDLSAEFGDRKVLSNVSFNAYQGEVTIVLGASGSGKTTILKHLLGLYETQSGTINVLNKNISKLTEAEQQELYLQMGVFYQNGALLNSLTVAENIALPLEQHTKLPAVIIDKMVRMKLSLVNLNTSYYLYPSQLSGGMLKRAALTRAIIMDPVLLFCDEPGAGLDPVTLASLDNLIVNLKQQLGMTVVMVTHELSSIKRIANRIVFLDKGQVVFQGTLQDVYKTDIQVVRDFFSKDTGNINAKGNKY